MIKATFRFADERIMGFTLCGHAGLGTAGNDILCAAVSGAAYMTANTLTDVCGVNADIQVSDGLMSLTLTETNTTIQTILEGFLLHMNGLQEQYPKRIQVLKTEV